MCVKRATPLLLPKLATFSNFGLWQVADTPNFTHLNSRRRHAHLSCTCFAALHRPLSGICWYFEGHFKCGYELRDVTKCYNRGADFMMQVLHHCVSDTALGWEACCLWAGLEGIASESPLKASQALHNLLSSPGSPADCPDFKKCSQGTFNCRSSARQLSACHAGLWNSEGRGGDRERGREACSGVQDSRLRAAAWRHRPDQHTHIHRSGLHDHTLQKHQTGSVQNCVQLLC